MLSIVRARLAQPTTRLLRLGASVNLQSARLETGLLSLRLSQQIQRGIVSSAVNWEPVAKKPAAKKKSAGSTKAKAKAKTGKTTKVSTAAKKKPTAKKAAPKKKTIGRPKTKPAAKPKIGARQLAATFKPVKRAPTSFAIFLGKFIKASDKPKSNLAETQEIAKEASRIWRGFNDFEKQPFVDEFKKLRETHDRQLAAWSEKALQNSSDFNRLNRYRASKGLRLHHIPKGYRRPASSFLRFFNEKRSTLTATTPVEQSKEAGRLWKQLTDKEQQVYKDQYAKAMADFKKQHGL